MSTLSNRALPAAAFSCRPPHPHINSLILDDQAIACLGDRDVINRHNRLKLCQGIWQSSHQRLPESFRLDCAEYGLVITFLLSCDALHITSEVFSVRAAIA